MPLSTSSIVCRRVRKWDQSSTKESKLECIAKEQVRTLSNEYTHCTFSTERGKNASRGNDALMCAVHCHCHLDTARQNVPDF